MHSPTRRVASSFMLLAPLLASLLASTAHAQREFVEEVEPKKSTSLDGVDLDAPDPATTKKPKDATKPDATKPDATKPDATKPDATKPDGTKPDVATPPPPAGSDAAALDAAAKAAATAIAESEGGVVVLETTHDAFLEKWDGRQATVRRGEVARARKQLPEIDAALLDFGAQGIPGGFHATAAANALLLEGRRALDDGNLEEAGALFDMAERANPDLVAVHTAQALLRWRGGNLGGTVNALADSAKTYLNDALALSQVVARGVAVVVIVGILALVLFALLAGVPALRYLSFDLLQALPKGAHSGQVLALVVMLALAPLVVGAGPVFGGLWI